MASQNSPVPHVFFFYGASVFFPVVGSAIQRTFTGVKSISPTLNFQSGVYAIHVVPTKYSYNNKYALYHLIRYNLKYVSTLVSHLQGESSTPTKEKSMYTNVKAIFFLCTWFSLKMAYLSRNM
jgi:hypothetical protein